MEMEQWGFEPGSAASQFAAELDLIGKTSANKRSGVINAVCNEYSRTAGKWLTAVHMLTGPLKGVAYGDKLLRVLTKERRVEKLYEKKEFVGGLIQGLEGDQAELARWCLKGLINKPDEIFQKGERSQRALRKASLRAVETMPVLAEALMDLDEAKKSEAVEKMLDLWMEETFEVGKEKFTPTDFIFSWAEWGDDGGNDWELATVSLGVVQILEDVFKGRYEGDMKALRDEFIAKGLELSEIWEKREQRQGYNLDFQGDIARVEEGVLEVIESDGEKNKDFCVISFATEWELANRGLWRLKESVVSWAKGDDGWDGELWVLPGGGLLMMFCKGDLDETEVAEQMKDVLPKYLLLLEEESRRKYKEGSGKLKTFRMDMEELEVLLEFTRPELDPKTVAGKKEELVKRVKAGWHGLSQRGNVVDLTRGDEQWLREMGMTKLRFDQMEEGIRVKICWGVCEAVFYFDRDCQVVGLEGLPQDHQDWLACLALSYLAVVKDPEMVVREGARKEEGEREGSANFYGRGSYLKVLTISHRHHMNETERQEAVTKCLHFIGLNPVELNEYFVRVQLDLSELEEVPKEYQEYISEAIERVRSREEEPYWPEVSKGKPRRMKLSNSPVGLAEERWLYNFTFVDESVPEEGEARPVGLSCPGAAAEMVELMEAG